MSIVTQHNILYSCEDHSKRAHEQFIPEHSLGYVVSGEMHFSSNTGTDIYREGTIGLIRKNQLAKTFKMPAAGGTPFKSISIFLDQESLRRYGAENNILDIPRYEGENMIDLTGDRFLKSYFDSLLPYFDQPEQLIPALAAIKTKEAIELLLRVKPELRLFLFDFSEPYKIDLEAFMNQNFRYNVPISQFAKLTGRSLSTFKRDFGRLFALPPEKWLLQKRLELAHYLIKVKHQSPGNVYLDAGFENLSHFSDAFKKFFGYNASSVYKG